MCFKKIGAYIGGDRFDETCDVQIPGMEWHEYYNWGGCPGDADWDQAKADAPNFSFEGVEFRWYKRFGRSMNVNVDWPADKWQAWFKRAIQTVDAWHDAGMRAKTVELTKGKYNFNPARSGPPVQYPDPSGRVEL